MDDQPEFERLRQTCSAALQVFLAEARKTELHMQQLRMPVNLTESRQVSAQFRAEGEALENYMLASKRLTDFLQQHLYIVN